jgi:cytochrome c oxidase subunit 3
VLLSRRPSLNAPQIGILVGVVSISAFFVALVVAYAFRVGEQTVWLRFAVPRALWASTVFILASSWFVERARYFLRRAMLESYRHNLTLWLASAVLFLGCQLLAGFELKQQGIVSESNPHGSAYYVFMVLHGVHLLAGLAWLVSVRARALQPSAASETALRKQRMRLNNASIYWHFMGALWCILFFFLLRWTTG